MDDREYEVECRRLALKEREMTLLEARHAFEIREFEWRATQMTKAEDALGQLTSLREALQHDHDDGDHNMPLNWPPRGRA